jgi:hypothetical protein
MFITLVSIQRRCFLRFQKLNIFDHKTTHTDYMLLRILFIVALMGVGYYLYRKLSYPSAYINCGKCQGKGYWIAMRGEKDKCDVCMGSGKVLK